MTAASDRAGQPLTPQEVAVCVAIADGCPNQQIAHQFGLGLDATKALIGRVLDKAEAQVRGRAYLTAVLIRAEVIAFDDHDRPVPGPCADRPVPAAALYPPVVFSMFGRELDGAERNEQLATAAAEAERLTAGTT